MATKPLAASRDAQGLFAVRGTAFEKQAFEKTAFKDFAFERLHKLPG